VSGTQQIRQFQPSAVVGYRQISKMVVQSAYNNDAIMLSNEVSVMINIKPSAAIRKNYNEIAELCKQSGEPVYLTKNGEGDLVVMDIETFARRESMLHLRENLLAAEEGRNSGKPGYSVDEVSAMMKTALQEVLDGYRK
jgi:PHD/YefM family antitoxin component YafN of YafNO toxin-antitoxin module